MSLLDETKTLLRKYRMRPKRQFGQNFMIASPVFEKMAHYVSLEKDDIVLDVGAGLGFLPQFLALRCQGVLAVEADSKLVEILHDRLRNLTNVDIVAGSIFKVELPRFNKVVSIPPYQIASHLISWLFRKQFDCAVMIFQREFANRLTASIGSEDYGWITVLSCYHFIVELHDDISRILFYPQPKVDSVIVRLTPRKKLPFAVKDEASFKRFVQSLFTQRNKKVRNAVLNYAKGLPGFSKEHVVRFVGSLPFQHRRVRELTLEDFGMFENVLFR